MAFVTNEGSFLAMPYALTESFLTLSCPGVADTLVLQQLNAQGDGYQPPSLQGLPVSSSRAANSSLIVTRSSPVKREWRDLAFVCNSAQVSLLELLAVSQTATQPCTVVDNMLKQNMTRLVLLQLASAYSSVYSTTSNLLVQFSLLEL